MEVEYCEKKYHDWLKDNINLKCTKTRLRTSAFEENFFYNNKDGANSYHQCVCKPSIARDCFDYIAMFDFISFKAVNDTFSHEMGDELLRRFGDDFNEFMQNESNKQKALINNYYDVLAFRHGGDEITIMLTPKQMVCINDVYEQNTVTKDTLSSWLAMFQNQWTETMWVACLGLVFGENTCSLKHVICAPNNTNPNLQEIYIKGFKLRCGTGKNVGAADKDMIGEEVERGIFNKECKFYIPDENKDNQQLIEIENNWKPFRDYIIYIMPKEKHKRCVTQFKKIIKSCIVGQNDIDIGEYPQKNTVFITVPVCYDHFEEVVSDKIYWPYETSKVPISRMGYISVIKKEIYKEAAFHGIDADIYYLNGKTLAEIHKP